MARRRVEDTNTEAPKTSAAERTVPLFPEAGPPLGTLTSEQREGTIADVQGGAIDRLRERQLLEKKLASEETGAITSADLKRAKEIVAEDIEREAIQEEAKGTGALGAGFFGTAPATNAVPPPPNAPFVRAMEDVLSGRLPPKEVSYVGGINAGGEEVSYTKGEEMYGKPGQFSTYRVGPFTLTTRTKPGESRLQALRRLSDEMAEFFNEERERAKKAFLAHYPNAFT